MNKQQVIEKIGKENWSKFKKWIYGQTCGITEDGELDYYEYDVDRFRWRYLR
jgi:hypothetical protein